MSQELMLDLQRRIALANASKAYSGLLFKIKQQQDFPNFTSIDSENTGDISQINPYSAPSSKNVVFDFKEETDQEAAQTLVFNLKKVLSSSDADNVVENLTTEDIKIMNQFFEQYLQSIKDVKFKTLSDFIDNIVVFIDKISNRVSISNIKEKKIKVFKAEPKVEETKIEQPNIEEMIAQNRNFDGNNDEKIVELVFNLTKNFDKFDTNNASTKLLFVYIYSDLKFPYKMLKEIATRSRNAENTVRTIVTKTMTTEDCRQLIMYFIKYVEVSMPQRIKDGKGLKNKKTIKPLKYGRGVPLKKADGKGYQGPIASKQWVSHHARQLYVDVDKLNNNILCVKYISNKKKKIELATTENVKMVIIQMMLDQFNYTNYDVLTEAEKKIVCYFNSMFHLINDKVLPNPIEELYTKFNILRGEINASNDNPLIKKNLKEIAFELHKYKKLNSAQIRNLFFELG
jgi:hypothetical protein